MSNNNATNAPALSPPIVIVICIAGAVVLVIIFAAVYRLCRNAYANADEDLEGGQWNPNRRNPEQMKYCEEVRWRNNALVWQSVHQNLYKRGWYRDFLEEQRMQDQPQWTPVALTGNSKTEATDSPYQSEDVSAEEFLTHHRDNPYQELLRKRENEDLDRHRQQSAVAADVQRPVIQLNDQPLRSPEAQPVQLRVETGRKSYNEDLADQEFGNETRDCFETTGLSKSLFPPRQSRMFRSSSIYSGDGLLPSNHLHMVQSSSSYALKTADRNT